MYVSLQPWHLVPLGLSCDLHYSGEIQSVSVNVGGGDIRLHQRILCHGEWSMGL